MAKTNMTILAAGMLAAAVAAPLPADAQSLRDFSITIGPKGLEVGVDRHRYSREGEFRRRCLNRDEFSRVVEFQGWRDLRDFRPHRDSVSLKARQWGGIYQLEFDDCSGQLLSANRLDFDRSYWDQRRGRRGR